MLDLVRYTITTPSSEFLPGVPNLSDVRRIALKESCRDILLSSTSAQNSERFITNAVYKTIVTSPTLTPEESEEAECKVSNGQWNELLLGRNSSDAATVSSAEEQGKLILVSALAGLEELIKMLHDILTHSRTIWKLSPSNRRDFIADALFDDPEDDNNATFEYEGETEKEFIVRQRHLFLSQFTSALNEINDNEVFSAVRKTVIVEDISSIDYLSLLLPARFDCEEEIEGEMNAVVGDVVDSNDNPSTAHSAAHRKTMERPSYFADYVGSRGNIFYAGGKKERNKSITMDEVFALNLDDISLSDDSDEDAPNQNSPQTALPEGSESANLAAFANVSKEKAREAINNSGGNTEEAAVTLLDLVKSRSDLFDVTDLPQSTTVHQHTNWGTESMNLAEAAGTTRHRARSIIDKSGGDLDRAAEILLNLMFEENDNNPASEHHHQLMHLDAQHSSRAAPHFPSISEAEEVNVTSVGGTSVQVLTEDKPIKGDNKNVDVSSTELQQHNLHVNSSRADPQCPPTSEAEEVNATPDESRPTDEQILSHVCDPLGSDSLTILAGNKPVKKAEDNNSKPKEEEVDDCPICFEVLETTFTDGSASEAAETTRTLKCGHSFCNPCVKIWVGKHGIPFPCPVCKTKIGYMSYHLKPWLKKSKAKKKKRWSA